MEITTEDQYQDAMTELKHLAEATADDEPAQKRKRELEAATSMWAEKLKAGGHRKGRPDPR
jgi:hypothetical protein